MKKTYKKPHLLVVESVSQVDNFRLFLRKTASVDEAAEVVDAAAVGGG